MKIRNMESPHSYSPIMKRIIFFSLCSFVLFCISSMSLAQSSKGNSNLSSGIEIAKITNLVTLSDHTGVVECLEFTHDGNYMASGDWKGFVRIWKHANGDLNVIKTINAHSREVNDITFSPDGTYLYSASEDGTIKKWSTATGELITPFEKEETGALTIAISPDGRYLAYGLRFPHYGFRGEFFKLIKIISATTGTLLQALEHTYNINSLEFSPDSKYLVSSCVADVTVKMWNASTGELIKTLKGLGGEQVAFHPSGKYLASASWREIKIWSMQEDKLIRTLRHQSEVFYAVVFSPDGKFLAAGSADHSIRVWDYLGNELLKTLNGHNSSISCVVFSPDSRFLASGSVDHTIKIWGIFE